jgi:hypothetical protein
MALKPLTPGYLPLGQYDLLDNAPTIVGGEVGVFTTLESGDYYAADAGGSSIAPDVKLTADKVSSHPKLFGLLDEGTSGYGTYYGTVIGGTVGQGTAFASGVPATAASGTGYVVVGPRTSFASGKATLWTMPGLYGVTADAFAVAPTTVNQALCGVTGTGKLTTATDGATVALSVNTVSDSSLVSTSAAAATGSAATAEFYAVYLLGPQA